MDRTAALSPIGAPYQRHLWADPSQLTWRPDETVYSLAARHHVLSCNARSSQTAAALFATPGGRIKHDFPTNLSVLSARAGGKLGSAEEILDRHTIALSFTNWMSPVRRAAFRAYCLEGNNRPGEVVKGSLCSSKRGYNELRACALCAADDKRTFGSPYWRRQHQLPGVMVCLVHRRRLHSLQANAEVGYRLVLPSERQFASGEEQPVAMWQLALAHIGVHIAGPGDSAPIEFARLRETYSAALIRRGLMNKRGFTDLTAAERDLTALVDRLDGTSITSLSNGPKAMCRQLLRLARNPSAPAHPVRHHLLILWLFGTWKAFQHEQATEQSNREENDDRRIGDAVPSP